MSGKRAKANGNEAGWEKALAAAAKAERKLLDGERKAERRLETARARLTKAEERLQCRQSEVEVAEADLRARQAARAAGPADSAKPAEAPDTQAPADKEHIVLSDVPVPALRKSKRRGAKATGTVLLPNGSPADGARKGDAPKIVTPGPAGPTTRRRKAASA